MTITKTHSYLEIYDLDTDSRKIIKEFDSEIEAPDWLPDGKHIIYNSDGLLYKIAVDGQSEPIKVDTGFATKCNNDHLVSPDGKWLGISHRSLPQGKTTIYCLPAEGGNPTQITPSLPSYLHGWSPDGKYLTYCANRNGEMDVYVIPSEGGEEIRLTNAPGLNDGPEYSPDGNYIWFNSMRTGLMQIWRMKADGSQQKQITFDEDRNSWFPHLSPDGKWVVYLSFKKEDVAPHEHLRYKHVELRILATTGGAPKTIVKLLGGQGSFNVNSWSPDSKQFAFISYKTENL